MDSLDRYVRHTVLPEIGEEGQRRLGRAAVLVVGCGALGSMLCQVMVRAGVGALRLVDPDPPEMHNLHRQVLYDEDDVAGGRSKAEIAAARLRRMNSSVTVDAEAVRVTGDNIERLLGGVDLVLDGTDNFDTRLLVNDACLKHGVPWVYGGVVGTVGMSMNVIPGGGPCFRCFVTEVPPEGAIPTTETHGVLSTAPMMVALIQATEGIKILLESPEVRRELTVIDVWSNRHSTVEILRLADCPACASGRYEFLQGAIDHG